MFHKPQLIRFVKSCLNQRNNIKTIKDRSEFILAFSFYCHYALFFGIMFGKRGFDMKNMRRIAFSLVALFALTACGGNAENSTNQKSSSKKDTPFTLIDPEDTSMLSANCKRYIDDMREQEESLEHPYRYNELNGEGCVDIDEISLPVDSDERIYLDKGDVNGQNKTVNGASPDRSDKSMGVDLKFNVKEGFEADEYKVLVSDNQNFDNAKELVAENNAVNVKNLFVNKTYYWKVVGGDKESEVSSFTTGDYPRWIDARPMFNVRDMGGYMTSSGKRVKQGLIYRGGEIVTQAWDEHLVTNSEASKKAFRETMDMVGGVEIDLRKVDNRENEQGRYKACAFAEKVDGQDDIEFLPLPIGSYGNTITGNKADLKTIFERFAQADEHHVYYHCYGGADRTGTIGFLLNGLLGVSYTDMVIDFELTSYSSINNEHLRSHLHSHQTWDHFDTLISKLQSDTTGGYSWNHYDSMEDKIEEFLTLGCGVSQETINRIREIMLED